MIEKLNKQTLQNLRTFLPEIVIVLLVVTVTKLYFKTDKNEAERKQFEKEVRTEVLTKLIESTEAIKQSTQALQKITKVIERYETQ